MFSSSMSSQSYNSFDFSMKTSSGDKINLSMYDNKETSLSYNRDKGVEELTATLKEEYGYNFSYSGDGIDDQDKKEIEAALKKIEPLLNIFKKENPSIEDKTNTAFDINALLPEAKDDNHQNFINDKLLDKMDEMLKAFDAVDEMNSVAKELFDMLDQQMEGFTLYA